MKTIFGPVRDAVEYAVRMLCKLLILAVSIAGLILILLDGIGKFFTSSEFTVEEITINGNQRVTQDEIHALSAIAPGSNIWLLDMDELRNRLEEHPSIRKAVVQRIPPKRIHIDIEERFAIAYYFLQDGTLLGLDAEGVALPSPPSFRSPYAPDSIATEDVQFLLSHPLLSGKATFPEKPGEQVTDPSLLSILVFINQLQNQIPELFREIVENQINDNGNYIFHLRRRIGALVLRDLKSPDLIKKIQVFWQVMEKGNLRAVYVDGRFPEKGFAVHADDTQSSQWEQMYRPHESI